MAYNSIDRIPNGGVDYWLADRAALHRNLIDNPFFTVNSRGVDSDGVGDTQGATTFCLDRWKVVAGWVSTGDAGVNYLVDAGQTRQYKRFFQSIRQQLQPGDELTVTVHLKLNYIFENWYVSSFDNNTQTKNVIALPDTAGEYWLEKTFTVPETHDITKRFGIGLYTNGTANQINADIYAVKLERGNYSTLAMDYPPDYYPELIKCVTATVDAGDSYANKKVVFE